MKTTILHVEAYDDIHSICDRITWCKSQRILLILPKRKKYLAQPLNLQLIDRAARQQGTQLGIVTKDRLIRSNAGSLGINVFRTISAAERDYWVDNGERSEARPIRGMDAILAEKRQLPSSSKILVRSKNSWRVIFATALVLLALLLVMVLPSTTVVLYPETLNQAVNLEIRASTLTNQSNINGLIPAWKETYTLSASRSRKSSGSVKVGKGKAQGDVRVVNLTGEVFDIPAGTIFITDGSNGQRFKTEKEFSIPVDSDGVKIPVSAILAGEDGNISSGELNLVEGVFGSFLEVTNEEDFAGGSSTTVPAPTAYDYNQLRQAILTDLTTDILSMSGKEKSSQSSPIVESLELEEIVEENMSNPIGEASDTATLELTASFRMLYYDPADINKIAVEVLDLSIIPNHHPVGSGVVLKQVGDVLVNSANDATWQVEASRLISQDYPRHETQELIKGMTKGRAIALLNAEIPHYRTSQVVSFPKWWPYLPILINRIQFEERIADGG